MSTLQLLDAAGRRRSPATLPGFHAGRPPRNKGRRYPPDPPRVEEIVAVMRHAGDGRPRLAAARADRRALAGRTADPGSARSDRADLDPRRGSVLVRRGKGGRRREVGMDDWGFEQLEPWLARASRCRSARCSASSTAARAAVPGRPRPRATQLRRIAAQAGVRRRFAPHQLRHAHALEMAREGVPLNVIQRQLGHRNLGVTSVYLRDRPRRDHRDRPRPTPAHDLRQRRVDDLTPHGLRPLALSW